MKTNIFYHSLIIVCVSIYGILLYGCGDDDFLKEKTETSYTLMNAFSVASQVNDCVTELYYYHKHLMIPNSNSEWFLNGQGTDICDFGEATNAEGTAVSVFSNWSSTYRRTERIFNGFYTLIAKSNLVIHGAEHVNWTNESDKKFAIAQARFFRGYSYMNLGELFGGVPITETFNEVPHFDFTRSTRAETYKYAINELEAAVVNLPNHPEAGRVGKGAAYHYLSECYLALAYDQNLDKTYLEKSESAASEVMKHHSLMTKRFGVRANPSSIATYNGINDYFPDGDVFFDLFQRGNLDYEEGNTESLWVDQNDISYYENYGKRESYLNFPQAFSPVLRNVYWKNGLSENGAGAGPWTGGGIGSDSFNLNENISAYVGGRGQGRIEPTHFVRKTIWQNCGKDIRNSEVNIRRNFKVMDPKHTLYGTVINEDNIANYAAESTISAFYPIFTKVVPIDDWGYEGLSTGKNNRANTYADFYYARLAETYLLRAEARLLLGNKKGAAEDINVVRSRSHADSVSVNDVDLDYILDERARELYGEERRWNTLLRIGGSVPNDRIVNNALWIVTYKKWSGSLVNDFLFPIPQTVIDSNLDVEIEQNDCWK